MGQMIFNKVKIINKKRTVSTNCARTMIRTWERICTPPFYQSYTMATSYMKAKPSTLMGKIIVKTKTYGNMQHHSSVIRKTKTNSTVRIYLCVYYLMHIMAPQQVVLREHERTGMWCQDTRLRVLHVLYLPSTNNWHLYNLKNGHNTSTEAGAIILHTGPVPCVH